MLPLPLIIEDVQDRVGDLSQKQMGYHKWIANCRSGDSSSIPRLAQARPFAGSASGQCSELSSRIALEMTKTTRRQLQCRVLRSARKRYRSREILIRRAHHAAVSNEEVQGNRATAAQQSNCRAEIDAESLLIGLSKETGEGVGLGELARDTRSPLNNTETLEEAILVGNSWVLKIIRYDAFGAEHRNNSGDKETTQSGRVQEKGLHSS